MYLMRIIETTHHFDGGIGKVYIMLVETKENNGKFSLSHPFLVANTWRNAM